ncbi:Metallo-dependent phosphatase [Ceraceosorus guamensis]|uniref:Metallo-dependent phosphatase n=1 Tax=Ceraceosorus guamensis TaxID=1522189 RepID=A0A316W5L0_9BASI|nr:Metallo-dependent phosphatase [Ceraceosorus guamensis]PWN45032.1 Metallo-dependent phosphatase [Ceraceosorus guamensis]
MMLRAAPQSFGTDVVHLQYDVHAPPPLASPSHARFVILSDTHSTEPEVPDGDVLLHCGDLTDIGTQHSFERFLDWFRSHPHQTKIAIAGNHDFAADNKTGWYDRKGRSIHRQFNEPQANTARVSELLREKRSDGFVYLEDERYSFSIAREGVRDRVWNVYGSPWTPKFGGWAWNHERGAQAKMLYANVPTDVDLLLTHGPPHGFGDLDVIRYGRSHVGCEELTRKLTAGELSPRIHAFGHIHEARGVFREQWPREIHRPHHDRHAPNTLFINAAVADMDAARSQAHQTFKYQVQHQPIIVDLDCRL